MDLPFEICYGLDVVPDPFDWDKVEYNNHFAINSQNILKSRFPHGNCDHIPGLTEVFETMELNLKSQPLDEWNKRNFTNNAK